MAEPGAENSPKPNIARMRFPGTGPRDVDQMAQDVYEEGAAKRTAEGQQISDELKGYENSESLAVLLHDITFPYTKFLEKALDEFPPGLKVTKGNFLNGGITTNSWDFSHEGNDYSVGIGYMYDNGRKLAKCRVKKGEGEDGMTLDVQFKKGNMDVISLAQSSSIESVVAGTELEDALKDLPFVHAANKIDISLGEKTLTLSRAMSGKDVIRNYKLDAVAGDFKGVSKGAQVESPPISQDQYLAIVKGVLGLFPAIA